MSDIPKKPHTFEDKMKLFLTASAVVGVIVSVWVKIDDKINTLITAAKLHEHDISDEAHPPLKRELEDCKIEVRALAVHEEENFRTQVALGARLVRMLAAESEPKVALKAAAANYYEQEFRLRVTKGASVEEAMVDSLRQSWYGRPRLP